MLNSSNTLNLREELIFIAEEKDRNYWADRLGVSFETLKSAIRATRSLTVDKVKGYLNEQGEGL